MTENLFTKDCIRTFTGLYMNVFEPTPEMINIRDIAHALSMECRFSGHLPNFYSVAEHSVMVSRIAPKELKLQALLHDASEAYLRDIPRPIKPKLTNYKAIEDKLMRIIAGKFGFDYPLSSEVHMADAEMLQWEWDELMIGIPGNEPVVCMDPKLVEANFLSEYYRIKFV